jgi:Flp pilus assembly protein CpaB
VLSHRRGARPGAINASTVFALTLAIVAGLILTLVFKMVVLDRKTPTAATVAATVKLTVASVNVLDRQAIEPGYIKTIEVSAEERNRWLKEASNRKTRLLEGSQPVGRTTVKALRAEGPVFEDMLEPFQYPRPVSELLAPGKRAAIVEVPSSQAMIQVGDHVDLLCTLSNDNAGFGIGNTATAILTRDAKVVARFNTTRTAAQPPSGANRSYTLETSPYRYAMIELAKSIGAKFALSVSPRTSEDGNGNGNGLLQMGMSAEADDPETDRVTTGDLARLFGVSPRTPSAEHTWEVERFSGLERGPSLLFTNYADSPNSLPGRSSPPVTRPAGAALNPARNDSSSSKSVASAGGTNSPNMGFRPVEDPNGCKNCSGKKR